MKKKRNIAISCGMAFTLLGACGSDSASNEEEVYQLDINNWQPSTHHYSYNVFEPWAEMVEEETDGRVEVDIYDGASLGEADSVYQDVQGGVYDVSLVVASYFEDTEFFPYTIGNAPFALEGSEEAADILSQFVEKYGDENLEENVKIMPPTATDPYYLFSTTPVTSTTDLNNLRMRVSGRAENAFVEAFGGSPVNLTVGETYEGLERDGIDTAFYTPVGALGLSFYEPAPYITEANFFTVPVIPIMNKDFFEELPEDLQKLFEEELNPALTNLFTESYEEELEAAQSELEELVQDRGEFITLSDTEMDEFRNESEEAWEAWIEDANDRGYDGQEMVDEFLDLLEEAGYPVPF